MLSSKETSIEEDLAKIQGLMNEFLKPIINRCVEILVNQGHIKDSEIETIAIEETLKRLNNKEETK